MKTTTPEPAAMSPRLEAALRELSKSTLKVSIIAKRNRIAQEEIWGWLTRHNRGRRELPAHVIDSVKAGLVSAPVAPKSTRALLPPARSVQPEAPKPTITPPPSLNPGKWLAGLGVWLEPAPTSFIAKITPEVARRLLILNRGNRTPSQAKIRRFAAAMKSGHGMLNGETIKFADTGRLLDGQSRLRAISEAGITVPVEVRFGLPDSAQASMDVGELRKGAHALEMLGEKYPQILAPALKVIWNHEQGTLFTHKGGKDVLENLHLAPLLGRHPGLKSSVGWTMTEGLRLKSILPLSTAAALHYLCGTVNAKARDQFFSALATGANLSEKSPIYLAREALLESKLQRTEHKLGKLQAIGLVLKAWTLWRAGKQVEQLSWKIGDAVPEFAANGGAK